MSCCLCISPHTLCFLPNSLFFCCAADKKCPSEIKRQYFILYLLQYYKQFLQYVTCHSCSFLISQIYFCMLHKTNCDYCDVSLLTVVFSLYLMRRLTRTKCEAVARRADNYTSSCWVTDSVIKADKNIYTKLNLN